MNADDKSLLIALGLGSNRGDSRRIILDAVKNLEQILSGIKIASLYLTDPLYVTDQERFVNTVVTGFYPGTPGELLFSIQKIETLFGRDRSREQRWGERSLDIDILLFGDLKVSIPESTKEPAAEPYLEIPHPRLKERRFALEPLLELLPDVKEPGTGLSYRNICQALPDQGVKLM